jgi:hypothetical protein
VRLRTLLDLRQSGVVLSNAPTPTTTTSVTISDWNQWLNAGRAELFRKVVQAAGKAAYMKTTVITTASSPSASVYPLPSDFWELVRVELQLNATDFVALKPFTEAERPYLLSATPGWSGEPFRYALQGKPAENQPQGIEFLPIPTGGLKLPIGYIYGPPLLAKDGDVLDGFAGFEEYVVVFGARRYAMRTEGRERAAELGGELARLEGDVLAQSKQIDAFSPPRVQMTRDAWRPPFARKRW